MNKYCPHCEKEVSTHVEVRRENHPVKGTDIPLDAQVRVCDVCAGSILDVALDDATLIKAYNAYRQAKNLLMPEEIRAIREMYGLSQREFARVLGLGEKTVTRYENGSLQDDAQNNLILLMRKRENFALLLDRADVTPAERAKMRGKASQARPLYLS